MTARSVQHLAWCWWSNCTQLGMTCLRTSASVYQQHAGRTPVRIARGYMPMVNCLLWVPSMVWPLRSECNRSSSSSCAHAEDFVGVVMVQLPAKSTGNGYFEKLSQPSSFILNTNDPAGELGWPGRSMGVSSDLACLHKARCPRLLRTLRPAEPLSAVDAMCWQLQYMGTSPGPCAHVA